MEKQSSRKSMEVLWLTALREAQTILDKSNPNQSDLGLAPPESLQDLEWQADVLFAQLSVGLLVAFLVAVGSFVSSPIEPSPALSATVGGKGLM